MNFNERTIHLLYNLLLILQTISTQHRNPNIRLQLTKLHPVEAVHSQLSTQHLQQNKKDTEENIQERTSPKQRQTETEDTQDWKRLSGKEENQSEEEPPDLQTQITIIQTQIQVLKTISTIIENIKMDLFNIENILRVDSLEKTLKYLQENLTKNKTKTKEEKEMNNRTYNNQYQIENIFIINQLSKEWKKEKEKEKTDVELPKGITQKAMNNREGEEEGMSDVKEMKGFDMVKKIQDDLSAMLQQGDLSAILQQDDDDRVDQMSKIIEFVERYHGTVSDVRAKRKVTAKRRVTWNS